MAKIKLDLKNLEKEVPEKKEVLFTRGVTKENIDFLREQSGVLGYPSFGVYLNKIISEFRRAVDETRDKVRPKGRRKVKKAS